MSNNNKSEQAIELLDNTLNQLKELYSDNPGMVIRFNSVFSTLSNSLKHSLGVNIKHQEESKKREPLTSVFGKKIISKKADESYIPIQEKKEFGSDVEKLRFEVQLIIPTLLQREPSEILSSIDELHLRAIGKTIGLAYDESVNINLEYVKTILSELSSQQEKLQQQEDLKLKADQGIEPTETTGNSPTIPIQEKKESIDINDLDRIGLVEFYIGLYGTAPHHNTKDETIREKIWEKLKLTTE